jgi:thioredoxin reductase (NADPH)
MTTTPQHDDPQGRENAPPNDDRNDVYDCVIIGAGPGGLTALEYLARFHRRAVALGAKGPTPRLAWIDRTYNLPGYPQGIGGVAMLKRLREQAEEYGGEVRDEIASRIDGDDDNFCVTLSNHQTLRARKVILAMGVRDREPEIAGIKRHVGYFLRYCPVCDGYEHTDKKLGIIGSGESVARHALFLRTFSSNITILLHGEKEDSLGRYRARLEREGIGVVQSRISHIVETHNPDEQDPQLEYVGRGVCLESGEEVEIDVLYGALGCNVNLDCVHHLNLKLDEDGYITTDTEQKTSVEGIYAVGDLVSQINQISVAMGQATIAAVRIHNALDDSD